MGFNIASQIGSELTQEEVITLIEDNAPVTPNATPTVAGKVFALTNANNNRSSTALGQSALSSETSGYNNTGTGCLSLTSTTSGSHNVANGFAAQMDNVSGSNNVAVGVLALGANVSGSNNVAIGHNAGYFETGSNKLYIANSNTPTPLIYGNFSSSQLTINGSLTVTNGINGYQTTDTRLTSFINVGNSSGYGFAIKPTWDANWTLVDSISASYIDSAIARLASPTFTGTPAAPTANAGTNTTQIATTAFVTTAISAIPSPTPAIHPFFAIGGV